MTDSHHRIDFEPVGLRGDCPAGQTLLESARQLGVDLVNLCGGAGTCGRCKVQVLEGDVSEPAGKELDFLTADEIKDGYRLACRAVALGDCKLRVPPESLTTPQRTQVEGVEVPVAPEPPVRLYPLQVPASSLDDLRGDVDRLLAVLNQQHQLAVERVDLAALRQLSPLLRTHDWQVQAAVRDDELIGVLAPGARSLGLAVDLGTTKIAGYLVDLTNGCTLVARGRMNPQIAYGEDVIARQDHAMASPAGAAQLQQLVVDVLNEMLVEMCAELDVPLNEVMEVVLVANTAMHHLLLQLPVAQLARAPYVPAVQSALEIKARDLGLRIAPGGYLYLLPNIAGYVGADHVAMMLATEVYRVEQGTVLALDIGTNTEVCLAHDGSLTSLSCASGPAFEGAHIKHGMRAGQGAIERVRIENGSIDYQTIGDAVPVGICGSGILDMLAQLVRAGVVAPNGKMNGHERVRGERGEREFVLVGEDEQPAGRGAITFSQKDVRELQLAKGAIRTGLDVLLASRNLAPEQIDRVIIAGAFGSYIDVESAMDIGMLPAVPLERVQQVGNAAGMGAKLALISLAQRRIAQDFAARVRYIELAAAPDFSQIFANSMYIR